MKSIQSNNINLDNLNRRKGTDDLISNRMNKQQNSPNESKMTGFQEIISILQKPQRNYLDNILITSYLSKMDNIIQNIFQGYQDNNQSMLHNISHLLNYEKIPKNNAIFRYGDDGNKFYIILDGQVEVLIPHIEEKMLNDLDYLLYLINLGKNREISLLKSSIELNKNLFPINESFEEYIRRFYNEYFYLLTFEDEKEVISEIFNQIENLLKSFLTKEKYAEILKVDETTLPSDQYVSNLYPKCLVKKNRLNKFSKKIYKVWIFTSVTSLKCGDKFGEKALLTNSKGRTATIITNQDTHLGTLNRESYNRCLRDVYEKIKNKNIFFLLSTPIFRYINHRLFEKNNYNNFICEKVKKNTIIFQENSPLNSIYFLKEGEYEVKMRKSLTEINELIVKLGGKLNHQKEEADLKSSSPQFASLMNKKMTFRLFIIKNSDILGLEEFPLETNSLYTLETVSNHSELLKIDFKVIIY